MSVFYDITVLVIILIFILFLSSLVGFYFYRKKQMEKVKIIKFIRTTKGTFSTYNIKINLFKDKKNKYVKKLLQELQDEKVINKIYLNSSNNSMWEINDNYLNCFENEGEL